jgi:hypothetical protein
MGSLELGTQSAYIRSRRWNTGLLSAFLRPATAAQGTIVTETTCAPDGSQPLAKL